MRLKQLIFSSLTSILQVILQLALQQFIAGQYTASYLASYFTTVIAGLYTTSYLASSCTPLYCMQDSILQVILHFPLQHCNCIAGLYTARYLASFYCTVCIKYINVFSSFLNISNILLDYNY